MAIRERWKGHPPLPEGLEERLNEAVARLQSAGAELVYVFGSFGQPSEERSRPAGDLDLAVWGMNEDVWRVRADLEGILGTDRVDLIRLEDAEAGLRFTIVAGGRRLHQPNPELENEVELAVLREYQDLAPFRRVQRERLRARHGIGGP